MPSSPARRNRLGSAWFVNGAGARDVAVDERPPQAMLVAAAARLSAGIKAGDDLALHVDDLRAPIDPETSVRVVPDRIERRCVERWCVDPVHGCVRPTRKLRIAALVDVRV